MKATSLEPRTMGMFNWIGFWTLYNREVMRFIKIYLQTILSPVVTILLYYVVFSVAFGVGRTIEGVPFLHFLAPGLIIMAMVQNAFMNTSSAMMISKYDGSIVDMLMPPLSSFELGFAKTLGGVTRGLFVGLAAWVTFVCLIGVQMHSIGYILFHAFFGSMMLSTLGLIVGIWADKFDHTAMMTNFVVVPLTFLSGTFYSVTLLPSVMQTIVHLNPFFYMIDGFRYGFIGLADGNLLVGIAVMLFVNLVLWFIAHWLLVIGYKIKS